MMTEEMRAAAWAAWMETESVWAAFDAAQKHDPVYLAARALLEAPTNGEFQMAEYSLRLALGTEPA